MSMRPPQVSQCVVKCRLGYYNCRCKFLTIHQSKPIFDKFEKGRAGGRGELSVWSPGHWTSRPEPQLQYYKCDGLAYYGILHQTKITIRHHFIIKMKEEKKLSYKKRLKILNGSRYLIIGQDLLSGVKSSLLDYQYLKGRI